MRKVELKCDENDQPRFTIIEIHHPDGEPTDGTTTPDTAPAKDK